MTLSRREVFNLEADMAKVMQRARDPEAYALAKKMKEEAQDGRRLHSGRLPGLRQASS